MKKYFGVTFLINVILLTVTSCSDNHNAKLEHRVLRYDRHEIGINDYSTYLDLLAYTNYQNNTLTAKDLYTIAKHYIDTVKADKSVSGVMFLGNEPDAPLPKGGGKAWFEQKKYLVISFGFSNNFERNIGKPVELNDISIFKNEKFTMYDMSRPNVIDSILKSTVALDND